MKAAKNKKKGKRIISFYFLVAVVVRSYSNKKTRTNGL
jgi:hypothetical protein